MTFLTFEGGDGAGKSTLLAKVENEFKRNSIEFVSTREPGGTPLADEIRSMILKPDRRLAPLTELFLFEAARAEHVSTVVRPALAMGKIVLCDRFTHSSLAFQGYARGLGVDLVKELNRIATGGLEPDAVIWLKLSPTEARARIEARGEKTRIDDEAASFHQAVFEAFEAISAAEHERFLVLDARLPPDDVFLSLLRHPLWKKLIAKSIAAKNSSGNTVNG